MGLSFLQEFQPPIQVTYYPWSWDDGGFIGPGPNSNQLNFTEFETIPAMIFEADSITTNMVERVGKQVTMSPLNESGFSWPYELMYFFSRNESIEWPVLGNLTGDWTEPYRDVNYIAIDDFSDYEIELFTGRFPSPSTPKEIIMSKDLANQTGTALNANISIFNTCTQKNESGFKVVGFVEENYNFYTSIYFQYDAFADMIGEIAPDDLIYWTSTAPIYAAPTLSVHVDMEDVTVYSMNEFVTQVRLLYNSIDAGISTRSLPYDVSNRVQGFEMFQAYILLFVVEYLAIMLILLMPVYALSSYVSTTINFDMFEKRTVEFAQFRSRGFEARQVTKVLGFEILISSFICAAGAGIAGVFISYPLNDALSSSGSLPIPLPFIPEPVPYVPFGSTTTLVLYIILVSVLSLMMIIMTYARPMATAFQKEMIDTLKAKVRERRRMQQINVGIVFSFIIGGGSLAGHLIIQAVLGGVRTQYISQYSMLGYVVVILAILAIFSPLLLSYGMLKLLSEKFPAAFSRLFSSFGRSRGELHHVITRNVSAKASKIAKMVAIILFTVTFGMMVGVSSRSLHQYRQENLRLVLGSDIKAEYDFEPANLGLIKQNITAKDNITSVGFTVSGAGYIRNQSSIEFMYSWFQMGVTNLTELLDVVDASGLNVDKYLYNTTWAGLRDAIVEHQHVAVLPARFFGAVIGGSLDIEIGYTDVFGNETLVTKTYIVAGYYRTFPGVDPEGSSGISIMPIYRPPTIILNDDFWNLVDPLSTTQFHMSACIKTPFADQEQIDNAASGMNLGYYSTLSNVTNASMPNVIQFNPANNEAFFNMLQLDYWLVFVISLVGVGILIFMKITAERKEIGLFRVRGFDFGQVYKIQLAEKYMPLLLAGLIGIVAGISGGFLISTVLGYNFFPPNPATTIPIDIIIKLDDVIFQALLPLASCLVITLVAIRYELRQDLGSITNEED